MATENQQIGIKEIYFLRNLIKISWDRGCLTDNEKPDAKKMFENLRETTIKQVISGKSSSFELQLLRAIHNKINLIKKNPFYGDNIPKKLIPVTYAVQNLWRIELPGFWRMLYTIKGSQIEIVCFVKDILSHKDYNKKFGYSS